MSTFTTPLIVEHHRDNTWSVVHPFSYDVGREGSGETIVVPGGFETDFASIPRIFWPVYNPTGKWGKAAVIHDWLYNNAGLAIPTGRSSAGLPVFMEYERAEADRIFREGMKVLGVRFSTRWTMYLAVRLFGRRPWRRHWARNIGTAAEVRTVKTNR